MEFQKFQVEENNTLDMSIKHILDFGLRNLSYILDYLKQHKSEIMNMYVKQLLSEFAILDSYDIGIVCEYEILKEYPELYKGCINKILDLLNYAKYEEEMIEHIISIKVDDIIRSMYIFIYFLVYPLSEFFSYEDSVEISKKITDIRVRKALNYVKKIETIDNYLNNSLISSFIAWGAHDAIVGRKGDNCIVTKITKCKWNDIMREMNLDSNFIYATICYGDFEIIKECNPNFNLSRKQTLVEGGKYCDFCYYDRRYNTQLTHPPEEYWEKLR